MRPMISYKGNAHFPKSLMSSFCSLKWQVSKPGYVCWNCKKSSYRRVLIHTQTLYATLSSSPHKNPSNTFDGFLLPSRNLWKFFEESVTMDLCFSHFSVLLRTTLNYFTNKNHILLFTQRIFASGDSRTGGFIAAKIFPEETFVQKRPLGQEQFCPSKCLTLLGKSTCGLAKYWHTRIQLLGQSV